MLNRGYYIREFSEQFTSELSITGTSPDLVQSLEFFLSRLISGFCLDQIKTRFESGLGLDKIQIIFLKLKKQKILKKLKNFLSSYSHSNINFKKNRKSRIYHFGFECKFNSCVDFLRVHVIFRWFFCLFLVKVPLAAYATMLPT